MATDPEVVEMLAVLRDDVLGEVRRAKATELPKLAAEARTLAAVLREAALLLETGVDEAIAQRGCASGSPR